MPPAPALWMKDWLCVSGCEGRAVSGEDVDGCDVGVLGGEVEGGLEAE